MHVLFSYPPLLLLKDGLDQFRTRGDIINITSGFPFHFYIIKYILVIKRAGVIVVACVK